MNDKSTRFGSGGSSATLTVEFTVGKSGYPFSLARQSGKTPTEDPVVYLGFYKLNPDDDDGCFIATAAYGTEMHPNLQYLRQYRDLVLRKTKPGAAFVQWYYSWSPAWAKWLNTQPVLRTVVRATLWPVVVALQALRELDSSYTLAAAVTVCLGVLVLATSVRMAAHVILRVGGALFLSKSKAD